METLIKQKGLDAIAEASKEAVEKHIREIAHDANKHLIDAAYSESLIPSLEKQIEEYNKVAEKAQDEIDRIEKEASTLGSKEAYDLRKQLKEHEENKKKVAVAVKRLADRKANVLEKISAHRYDAQAGMHRIAFFTDLAPDTLLVQLTQHIKSLEKEESN